MSEYDHLPNDVLILGSDGLWDVTSNARAVQIVQSCLSQFGPDERIRYDGVTFTPLEIYYENMI